ncbi:histidine phosphatase family protein [Rhizohabitans arisaemae]|uniref:histidine phosphatase family protein n=1 Tax=Rhizohabitans arisaemae TaxID=2720610 RepID=UPI0024B1AC25|nr:histidine phosphatase family protein [Rhizohabitans arisaemae]
MRRLILVRHAVTPGMRRACFPSGEHADPAGLRRAAALAGAFPGLSGVYCSPEPVATQTLAAAGLRGTVAGALAAADHGRWSGLPYAQVAAAEPEALRRWREDPDAAPHGGESIASMVRRVSAWLDGQSSLDGTAVVCCDAGPIRAVLARVLGLDPAAADRIDLAPLSVTRIASAGRGGWRVGGVNGQPRIPDLL